MLVRISATTSAFGFVPCGPPWPRVVDRQACLKRACRLDNPMLSRDSSITARVLIHTCRMRCILISAPCRFSTSLNATVNCLLLALISIGSAHAQTPPAGNLLAWLKAEAGVELSGTNVISWTNQMPGGIVFTAPAPSARPVFATNVVNGLPALRFNGAQRLLGNLGRVLTNATIFTLSRHTVASSDNDYLYTLGLPTVSGSQITLSRRDGDDAYHFDGNLANSPDTSIPAFTFQVFSQVFGEAGATNHQLYLNQFGLIDSDASSAYVVNATNAVLGNYSSGSFYFIGDLVEWLVYDRVLSESERKPVEEYLRQRAALPPFFAAGSLDLTGWETVQYEVNAQPDAQWVLKLNNRAVDQLINSDPSIYLSPFAVANQTIHARMGSGSAPDAMGFVFGYQDRGHYYLFDWKKVAASYQNFGVQPRGMRLRVMHVPGGNPTGADFWSALNVTNSTTLRTNDLAWVDGADYDLVLRLKPGLIELEVNQSGTNLVSWSVTNGAYASGRFGYYVNSLQYVRFGQIVLDSIAPYITSIQRTNNTHAALAWINGLPPFQIQTRTNLTLGDWQNVGGSISNQNQTVPSTANDAFFRIRGNSVPP